ncbi:hypothetical protein FocTR4_00015214 [Fusarium oxysporum f. sp. cubense]|uniref:Uncharacterized protein n=1 Tax=Fusarium oxysporum f. sp. cubense TaxID=61366 RepID=A0A5C6SYN7_FUSOC|nr:hypothetical protein FocTR4_00015214 [Fusarium oxysporum f. sp. cubense]
MLQAHPGPLPPLHRNYIGGYDVFEAFENIKKQDVFKPNSEIRNLGSVLVTFIRWRLDVFCGGVSFFSIYDESLPWICKVADLAEESNVKFTVLMTLRKIIDRSKAFEVVRLGGWINGRMSTGKAGDYKDEKGSDKLGGHDFDITTMTEIERWRHEDK